MSEKKDSSGRKIVLCWLCNGYLQYAKGKLVYAEVTLPNDAVVKLHKVCAKDFKENPCSYKWERK